MSTVDSKVAVGVVAGALLGMGLAKYMCPATRFKKNSKKVTLRYFDGRGLAEVARQMLAVAGVEYTDKRYTITVADGDGPVFGRLQKPEMEADAATGMFQANMGRLPVLEVEDISIGGSKAIYRYIAKTYGLAGNNACQEAQIDNICELVNDVSEAFGKQDDKDKWFDTDSAEGKKKQSERQLQWYLEQLEKCVGSDGFAVGSKVSMADAVIYSKFAETCTTAGLFGNTKSEPMGNGEKVRACLDKCAPKLAKICDTFGSLPAMKEYLAQRSKSTPLF